MVISGPGAQKGRTRFDRRRPPPPPNSASSAADTLRKMNQNYAKSKLRCASRFDRHRLVNVAPRFAVALGRSGILNFSKTLLIWFALSSLTVACGQADQTPSTLTPGPSSQVSACPNCYIAREDLRQYTLHEIKQEILARLGFVNGAPNVTTSKVQTNENPFVKRVVSNMKDLYSTTVEKPHPMRHKLSVPSDYDFQRIDDDDDRLKTFIVVALAKPCVAEGYCKKFKSHSPLNFLFEPKNIQNKMTQAILFFYQRPLSGKFPDGVSSTINITIYKLNPQATAGSDQYTLFLSVEKNLTSNGKWIEIDIKESLVQHLQENDSNNITLVILPSHSNKGIVSKLVTDIRKEDGKQQHIPFVQIWTEESKNRRNKRSANNDCKEDHPNNHCCRYPLTVDFEDFKWDFIIAPKRYEAYYCSGRCDYLDYTKHNHGHLIKMSKNATKFHTPCCGPRKLSPIGMIYFNEQGNVIYGILPGMVVDRCGCF